MKRIFDILSIDFDYFVDADIDTRDTLFPQGIDDSNESYLDQWEKCYRDYPKLLDIGVKHAELETLINFLYAPPYIPAVASPTHKDIYNMCTKRLCNGFELTVANVDFHHDMFDYAHSEDEVNCGNWAKKLKEKYPREFQYEWLGALDSETRQLGGGSIPMSSLSLEGLLNRYSYDTMFLCLSSAWTPPHLDTYFRTLLNLLNYQSSTKGNAEICKEMIAREKMLRGLNTPQYFHKNF